MKLKFFTQNIILFSKTYHDLFKGKWPVNSLEKKWATVDDNKKIKFEMPVVNMTAEISFQEDEDQNDNKLVIMNIENCMWEDPNASDNDDYECDSKKVELEIKFYLEEMIHIRNYLNSAIEIASRGK